MSLKDTDKKESQATHEEKNIKFISGNGFICSAKNYKNNYKSIIRKQIIIDEDYKRR